MKSRVSMLHSMLSLLMKPGILFCLRDVINKPTILNLVYFNCPGTCSPLMWGVSKFIDQVDLKLGTDYEVITISFDPTERIDLGIKKKASYISTMTEKRCLQTLAFFCFRQFKYCKANSIGGFNYRWINDQYVHPTGFNCSCI